MGIIKTILKTNNGELVNGDNIEVLKTLPNESYHNCISDFPYNLSFMGKKWDTQSNFYDWCKERANELYRVLKSGGYVLIFGHHKSNHRMKCAFEDVGFQIVEEIDWVYGSGFPKNQDISKMFDKKANAERKVVGVKNRNYHAEYKTIDENNQNGWGGDNGLKNMRYEEITEPSSDLAKQWNGWKTSGLKPAKEIITVFQKPLEGKYLDNIEKHGCGAMNIDACRVPTSQEDKDMMNKNPTTNYSDKDDKIYGAYAKDMCVPANEIGRFPSNVIFDDTMGTRLDEQSRFTKSTGGSGEKSMGALGNSIYGKFANDSLSAHAGGLGDEGGASRYFLHVGIEEEDFVPFLYCPKPTKKEKGEDNIHVTVKPKKLIKWLIKLVTPKDGYTLDITAGSGTHGLCCEELNKEEGYSIRWLDIEMMNTDKEPYCEIAKQRIEQVAS